MYVRWIVFLFTRIHDDNNTVKLTYCRHWGTPLQPTAVIIGEIYPIVKITLPPERQGVESSVEVVGFYHGTGKVHHVVQGKDADDYAGHYR